MHARDPMSNSIRWVSKGTFNLIGCDVSQITLDVTGHVTLLCLDK